jgi:hypothetical protein
MTHQGSDPNLLTLESRAYVCPGTAFGRFEQAKRCLLRLGFRLGVAAVSDDPLLRHTRLVLHISHKLL